MPAAADQDTNTEHADLTRLAAQLTTHGYTATLRTPPGATPHLHITNPQAPALTERVCAQGGNYWYSWGQPITTCDDPVTAAAAIARVLRTAGD